MFTRKHVFLLFKLTEHTLLQNIEVNNMSNKNSNSQLNNENRLHVLGIDTERDPCIGHKQKRSIHPKTEFTAWLWVFLNVARH